MSVLWSRGFSGFCRGIFRHFSQRFSRRERRLSIFFLDNSGFGVMIVRVRNFSLHYRGDAMTGTIRVGLSGGSWMADFGGTDAASEYASLFGTCVLPLPFTAGVPVGVVVADVEARNRGCMVEYGPTLGEYEGRRTPHAHLCDQECRLYGCKAPEDY